MTQSNVDLTIYDSLNFDGLERRANYRIIAFREDVLVAFERKDAAAILYNIIYRWLDNKRDEIIKENEQRKKQGQPLLSPQEVEERMWVYMSYNDFARECGGAVSYNTVIATLDYLVNIKQVFERRENHDPRFADYEYRINRNVMAELLKALPVHPPTYTRIGIGKKKARTYTNSGTPTTKVGTETTNSGSDLYQSWGTSQNPTENTHNYTQKEERVAIANAPSPSSSFENVSQVENHSEKEEAARQTSEVNRSTNAPSSLTEKTVNTDEVPGKIETEMQERTPVSQGIEAQENTSSTPKEQNDSNIRIADKDQPKQSGTRKKKQKVDLDKIKPLPRPERPSDEMPWNAKKLLAWGDYFRGHTIPFSERANSRYQWAEQSAIALIERNIEEKHFLAVMRFMRGVNLKLEQDLEFRDDWWPTHQLADLWDAEKHFDNMLNKARQTLKNRKQNTQARAGVASTMMTPQTRQPENPLEAPKEWKDMLAAKRAAGGGY